MALTFIVPSTNLSINNEYFISSPFIFTWKWKIFPDILHSKIAQHQTMIFQKEENFMLKRNNTWVKTQS